MQYLERITIDPAVRNGKPCVKGTRMTVAEVFDYLAGGTSIEQLLEDFPYLKEDDVRACFAYAAARDRQTVLG